MSALERDVSNRCQFTKVQDHPFFTRTLFGSLKWIISDHPLQHLVKKLEQYEEILINGNDVRSCNTRALLGYRDATGTIASSPQRGPCFDMAIDLFATYHLVDIVSMTPSIADISFPPADAFNTIRAPSWTTEDVKSFKRWDTLSNWPKTLFHAHQTILNPGSKQGVGQPTADHDSVSMKLLCSLAWSHNTRNYCSITANFQAAALYLTALLDDDGPKDSLPGIERKLELAKKNLFFSKVQDDVQVAQILQQPWTRNVRVPLHLALLVSPIYLLSHTSLCTKPPNQNDLWRVCTSIGNDKPALLLEIEMAIWQTVWNISRHGNTSEELRKLVTSDRWKVWEATPETNPAALYFLPRVSSAGSSESGGGIPSENASRPDRQAVITHVEAQQRTSSSILLSTAAIRTEKSYSGSNPQIRRDDVTSPIDASGDEDKATPGASDEMDTDGTMVAQGTPTKVRAEAESEPSQVRRLTDVEMEETDSDGDELEVHDSTEVSIQEVDHSSPEVHGSEKDTENSIQVEVDHSSPEIHGSEKDTENSIQLEVDHSSPELHGSEKDAENSIQEVDHSPQSTQSPTSGIRVLAHRAAKNFKSGAYSGAHTPSVTIHHKRKNRQPKAFVEGTNLGERNMTDENHIIDVDDSVIYKQLITLDITPVQKFTGQPMIVYDVYGRKYELAVEAHDKQTLRFLNIMANAIKKRGKPKFINEPSDSCIRVLDQQAYDLYPTENLLQLLDKQHVIVTHASKPNESPNSFKHALRGVGCTTTVRTIQDLSLTYVDGDLNGRCREGTLKQLAEAAEDVNGKILNALDIPTEMKGMKEHKFSSDFAALSVTSGDWKTSKPFPAGHCRWALAATRGAFHGWHIDSNGFGTYIEPQCGYKVWILARPKASNRWDSISLFDPSVFEVDKLCPKIFDFEVVLLCPGTELFMAPNTPHMVYTPHASVCHGGHFYSTYTMEKTLAGTIHGFIAGNIATNTNHVPARLHIQQMISFCHKALVMGQFEEDDPILDYVPKYNQWSGFTNLMCLCICGILMNVLDYSTYETLYQSSCAPMSPEAKALWKEHDVTGMTYEERKACIYARGQALEIMAWLDHTCSFADVASNAPMSHTTLAEYQVRMLTHYCQRILEYKKVAMKNEQQGPKWCSLEDVFLQLSGTASGDMNLSIRAALEQPCQDKILGMGTNLGWAIVQKEHAEFQPVDDLLRKGECLRDTSYLTFISVKKEKNNDFSEPPFKKQRVRK